MLKLLKIWFLLTNLQLVLTECQKGCLKCTEEDNCQFCDITSFFIMKSGKCVETISENCYRLLSSGKCEQCEKDFYLDQQTGKCVAVVENRLIPHCLYYSSGRSCQKCRKNYYIRGSTCQEVEKLIDDCEFYSSNTSCLECQFEYLLSADKKKCIESPLKSNCSQYQRGFCSICKKGFILNRELKTKSVFSDINSTNSDTLGNFVNELILGKLKMQNQNVCEKINVKNCLYPITADLCGFCEIGYLLMEDKTCKRFPIPGIVFCRVYLHPLACKECEQGYFLENEKKCVNVKIIEQCELYDPKASDSQCSQCKEGYFNQNGVCLERKKSQGIKNCKVLDVNDDKCEKCNLNFELSPGKTTCFSQIPRCIKHSVSSSNSRCERCENGYFVNNGDCTLGKIENCEVYSTPLNCSKCSKVTFLQKGKCIPHNQISHCIEYSPTFANTCKKCSSNNFPFKIKKTCLFQTLIDHCQKYDNINPGNCAKCENGFYLNEGHCKIIQNSNCAQFDGSTCQSCLKNHVFGPNGNCVSVLSFIEANCEKTNAKEIENLLTIDEVKCESCITHHIPLKHKNQYVCVSEEELSLMGITDDKKIKSCLKYDIDVCVQCEETLFLENGNCVRECASKVYRLNRIISTVNGREVDIVFDGFRECVDVEDTEEGNEILALDVTASDINKLDIIIKCKKDFLPLIYTYDLNFSNANYENQPSEYVKIVMKKFPGIQLCMKPDEESPIIPNCQYYNYIELDGIFYLKCLKCQHGFSSIILEGLTKKKKKNFYLENCVRNSQCRASFVDGLDIIWIKYYSCHICSQQDQIPFLALKMERVNILIPLGFSKYTLSSIDHLSDSEPNLKNIECLVDAPSSFGYDLQNINEMNKFQALPDECALGVINLDQKDGDSRLNQDPQSDDLEVVKQLAHFCAACNPGYKGTQINNVYFYIKVKCEPILNCASSEWFNNCSQCQPGFTWGITGGLIDFAKCSKTVDQNCFAVADQGICMACKRGFNLNDDFICESLTPPNCKSASYFNSYRVYKHRLNLFYGLYHDSLGLGCNHCRTGYYAVKLSESTSHSFLCTSSLYLQAMSSQLPNESRFVKNCTNYVLSEERMLCKKCAQNFVINETGENCFEGLLHCRIAENSKKCIECKQEYSLVNGVCQFAHINNCKELNYNKNHSSPRCIKCMPNFYLTSKFNCEQGVVPNCELHQNFLPNKCIKCMPNYALFIQQLRDYCYLIAEELNCEEAQIKSNSQFGAELSCQKCRSKNYLLSDSAAALPKNSLCMPFNQIEHCSKYDIKNELSLSSLGCLECSEGFYNDQGLSCIARKYFSPLCEKYAPIQDSCWVCSEEAFIDRKGICHPKPEGIPDCLFYSQLNICEMCFENYYLEKNSCHEVKTKLAGCKYYLTQTTCRQCHPKFYLNGTFCEPTVAQNCKEYVSAKICKDCSPGYGLTENDGVVDCILVNKPNCIDFEQFGSFKCIVCEQGYFPNSTGDCISATNIINNCLVQVSDTECKKCDFKFALEENKSNCIPLSSISSTHDPNCEEFDDKIYCSLCRPGSIFEGNSCVECADSLGCFKCDRFNTTQCIMCQPGYYMDKDQSCISVETFSIIQNVASSFRFVVLWIIFISLLQQFQF